MALPPGTGTLATARSQPFDIFTGAYLPGVPGHQLDVDLSFVGDFVSIKPPNLAAGQREVAFNERIVRKPGFDLSEYLVGLANRSSGRELHLDHNPAVIHRG